MSTPKKRLLRLRPDKEVSAARIQETPPAAPTMIANVRQGLPFEEIEMLRSQLALPLERMPDILGIPRSTLMRRKTAGVFSPQESERIVRFARLFALATEVLEGEEMARAWLGAPQRAFNGETPLQFADTEPGAREVELLLHRLDHGVFA